MIGDSVKLDPATQPLEPFDQEPPVDPGAAVDEGLSMIEDTLDQIAEVCGNRWHVLTTQQVRRIKLIPKRLETALQKSAEGNRRRENTRWRWKEPSLLEGGDLA